MLELIIAGSMLAGVMTSLTLVMRSTRQAWEINDDEAAVLQQMHAVARHFVRSAREANSVSSIAADGSGITLEHPNGETTSWRWSANGRGMSDVVTVTSSDAGSAILAQNIDSMRFEGFGADGVTPVSDPSEVSLVAVTVAVNLPSTDNPARQTRCNVWIRSW